MKITQRAGLPAPFLRIVKTFAQEPIAEVLHEIKPLLWAHFKELSFYPDIPLEPAWDRYAKAEAAEALRIYTARHRGQLVGYAIFTVDFAAHYRSSLQALQDILWVAKEHRGRYGLGLVRFAEQQLRDEGVQVIRHHVKAAHPALGELLTRMGYRVEDYLMSKRLDWPQPE